MFEYSFGFYLTRLFKDRFKRLNLIGYQHGIFSDNLMWFDLIRLLSSKKNYFPNKVIALNDLCAQDYKKKTNKIPVLIKEKKKYLKLLKIIKKVTIKKLRKIF